jgi:hypothetical protein
MDLTPGLLVQQIDISKPMTSFKGGHETSVTVVESWDSSPS